MLRGAAVAIGAVLTAALVAPNDLIARAGLPSRLSDAVFWSLIESSSEPNGYFRSDNLVSDEAIFADVVPDLLKRRHGNGVYVGVGPEQNFTYIAALKPPMAFIVDIRRGNLHLQLLYKALFELSADRAEFVSRLFVKPRPATISRTASAADILGAYWQVPTANDMTFNQYLTDVRDVLVNRHQLPLSVDDLKGIEYVYHGLYWFGPRITWSSSASQAQQPSGSTSSPAVADLLRQKDANGRELSFLATEARFSFVKTLQGKNLVVPVVGNFAGPKAVRAVGQYLRDHGSQVDAFYVSEVEAYLVQDGLWPAFCRNLASLPRRDDSVLIRPALSSFGWPGPTIGIPQTLFEAFSAKTARLVPIAPEVRACAGAADERRQGRLR